MAGRPRLRIGQHGNISRRHLGGGVWEAFCRFRDSDGVVRKVQRVGPADKFDKHGKLAEDLLIEALAERHSRASRGDGQPCRVRRLLRRARLVVQRILPDRAGDAGCLRRRVHRRVFGQVANAFACRSTMRFAWQIPLRTNWLLIVAILCELVMLAAFIYIPPLAHLLGQSGPNGFGILVAALAVPAVLAADTLQKRIMRSGRTRVTAGATAATSAPLNM
jgi:cation transport ATPase-like protein